jgi:uncharacterized protein (DUF736 family)
MPGKSFVRRVDAAARESIGLVWVTTNTLTSRRYLMIRTALLAATFALAVSAPLAEAKPKARSVCPSVSILADASRMAVVQGSKVDLKAEIVTPRLGCNLGKGSARASLSFMVKGAIAPDSTIEARTVPYFVAVIAGGRVIEKQVFDLNLPFAGTDRTLFVKESVARVDIPIASGTSAEDYSVTIGFQLTEAQLAWNRANTR